MKLELGDKWLNGLSKKYIKINGVNVGHIYRGIQVAPFVKKTKKYQWIYEYEFYNENNPRAMNINVLKARIESHKYPSINKALESFEDFIMERNRCNSCDKTFSEKTERHNDVCPECWQKENDLKSIGGVQ